MRLKKCYNLYMKNVEITSEYITLGQLLKYIDLVSTGGEVKYFLNSNKILINNIEDNRKGRKLYKGDQIVIKGETYKIC